MKPAKHSIRGVNLGGWLLTEKWITPSLYAGTAALDEYSLATSQQGRQRLAKHRQTFIQQSDIKWLHGHGINALRIPVGHWIFDGKFDDNVSQAPSIEMLDKVMDWAGQYQMRVLVDLHGLAGSQSGLDHSGQIGKANWLSASNQAKNLATLANLAQRYRDHTALWGIEIANEPNFGLTGCRLRKFHTTAYKTICEVVRPGTYTIFADGYRPHKMSGSLRPKAGYPIAMDTHFYQIFSSYDKRRSVINQLKLAAKRRQTIQSLQRRQPVIIGEWSGVLASNSDSETARKYLKTQRDSYDTALGWFYWTYKTEGQSAWSLRHVVEENLLDI